MMVQIQVHDGEQWVDVAEPMELDEAWSKIAAWKQVDKRDFRVRRIVD